MVDSGSKRSVSHQLVVDEVSATKLFEDGKGDSEDSSMTG